MVLGSVILSFNEKMVNWSVISQLASLALVLLSGPLVIFALYATRGNL